MTVHIFNVSCSTPCKMCPPTDEIHQDTLKEGLGPKDFDECIEKYRREWFKYRIVTPGKKVW
jgi:hypothetical protein